MIDIIRGLATLPIPLVLLLVIGLMVWRRRSLSRVILTAATMVFVALSLPITGKWLEAPLIAAAPAFDASRRSDDAIILVPAAGIFADSTGTLWPSSTSIIRAIAGRELQAETGFPLVLIGGSPRGEAESEAIVVARAVGLVDSASSPKPGVHLETAALNSAETALSARKFMEELGAARIILVTSPTHTARMAASLRHVGAEVSIYRSRASKSPPPAEDEPLPFLPSGDGFSASTGAVHEYLGILWYLLKGKFTWSDLVASESIDGI